MTTVAIPHIPKQRFQADMTSIQIASPYPRSENTCWRKPAYPVTVEHREATIHEAHAETRATTIPAEEHIPSHSGVVYTSCRPNHIPISRKTVQESIEVKSIDAYRRNTTPSTVQGLLSKTVCPIPEDPIIVKTAKKSEQCSTT